MTTAMHVREQFEYVEKLLKPVGPNGLCAMELGRDNRESLSGALRDLIPPIHVEFGRFKFDSRFPYQPGMAVYDVKVGKMVSDRKFREAMYGKLA